MKLNKLLQVVYKVYLGHIEIDFEVKNGKAVYTPEERLKAINRKKKYAPVHAVSSFTAKLYLWNPTGRVKIGYSPNLHVHNTMAPIKFAEILKVYSENGTDEPIPSFRPGREVTQTEPAIKQIEKGQIVLVKLEPTTRNISVDTVKKCPKLGRFVLREGYTIIGAGLIMDVDFKV